MSVIKILRNRITLLLLLLLVVTCDKLINNPINSGSIRIQIVFASDSTERSMPSSNSDDSIRKITITITDMDLIDIDVTPGETVAKTIDGVPVGTVLVVVDLKNEDGDIMFTQLQEVDIQAGKTSAPEYKSEDFVCPAANNDCAGVCGGSSVLSGCDNVCNSTAVVDDCEVCGGDGSTCLAPITVISPNGNEEWAFSTSQEITWSSNNITGKVKIELYSGSSLYQTIASSTSNDGIYIWSISSTYSEGSNYKIKISSVYDNSIDDYSDSYFSLSSSPVQGCTDNQACNYNLNATVNDGSCTYAEINYDCDGDCIADIDCSGECGGSAVDDECGVCGGDGSSCGTTVTDIDGNVYQTVQIGDQLWMAENLKVTNYRDGSAIPNITNNAGWSNLSIGAYGDYDNNPTNSETYGRLYNWYTVDDSRGVCPEGWHVPSDNEYTILTDYLSGESVAGGKMKEAGLDHWNSPNTGATNESGFTGLPAGYRYFANGGYYSMSSSGHFWSSSEDGSNYVWFRKLYNNSSDVGRVKYPKRWGFSIRCIEGELNQGCTDVSACNYDETASVDDGSCTYAEENYDCSENCIAATDCLGVCGGFSVLSGCDNTCNSTAVDDCADVCGGFSVLSGCDNTCNSTAVDDCAGVCGGSSVLSGCDNLCGSTAVDDCAGVCGGSAVLSGCDNVCNSTAVEDVCGECGGDGSSCAGGECWSQGTFAVESDYQDKESCIAASYVWFSASSECESISASTISGDITSPSGTISAGNYVDVEWNIPGVSSQVNIYLYHENNKVYLYQSWGTDDGSYSANIYSNMSNLPNSSCWHFKIESSYDSDNYIMGQYFTIE